MELVAASKMRKSVNMTLASRDYARTAADIVESVRTKIDPNSHPLLAGRVKSESIIAVIASSDRGLCGGFNSQVLKKSHEFLRSRSEKKIRVITVGKRAELSVKRAGYEIMAAFESISNAPSFERTRAISDLIYKEFVHGDADRVFMIFTDYRSALSQIPTIAQLLPIIPENEIKLGVEFEKDPSEETNIIFEPSPKEILNQLFPRLLETRLYQALLETSASEHAARMMAMRSATSSASDMLNDLTFTYNQARQAGITREISEISAGKAAIE